MEMKYVVPDMAQSFGTLEFAGESDHVFDRDKDNRRFFARRSYNLYSDVQRGENVVVEIPVQAKAGDLVFFHSTYNTGSYVTHVGIYVGNNQMYHAGDPIGYADLSSSYWQQHLIGAGRVKQQKGLEKYV